MCWGGVVLQGLAENAQVLSDLVGGGGGGKQQDVVTELFAYMNLLGIQGMGLVEATERSSHVGHIIGEKTCILAGKKALLDAYLPCNEDREARQTKAFWNLLVRKQAAWNFLPFDFDFGLVNNVWESDVQYSTPDIPKSSV